MQEVIGRVEVRVETKGAEREALGDIDALAVPPIRERVHPVVGRPHGHETEHLERCALHVRLDPRGAEPRSVRGREVLPATADGLERGSPARRSPSARRARARLRRLVWLAVARASGRAARSRRESHDCREERALQHDRPEQAPFQPVGLLVHIQTAASAPSALAFSPGGHRPPRPPTSLVPRSAPSALAFSPGGHRPPRPPTSLVPRSAPSALAFSPGGHRPPRPPTSLVPRARDPRSRGRDYFRRLIWCSEAAFAASEWTPFKATVPSE
jgi:hypothetical protein